MEAIAAAVLASEGLVYNILSFCDIFERSKCLAVCSQMKAVSDSMSGALVLNVSAKNISDEEDEEEYTAGTDFHWHRATSTVTIRRFYNNTNVLPCVFPQFCEHGMEQLRLNIPFAITTPLLSNISELSLEGLADEDSAGAIRGSFPHLRKLTLLHSQLDLSSMLSVIVAFKELTTLELQVTSTNIQTRVGACAIGRSVSILSSLPNLTNLTITADHYDLVADVIAAIVLGISEIKQLKVLDIEGLRYHCAESLGRMTHLEELSGLDQPLQETWNSFRAAGTRMSTLRKLGISDAYLDFEAIEDLAVACIDLLPVLTHLDINVGPLGFGILDIQPLSRLQNHASLRYVSLSFGPNARLDENGERIDENAVVAALQGMLGENIVVEFRSRG